MNRFRFLFAVLTVLLLPQLACSDELRPGYLEMRQTSPFTYNLLSRFPRGGRTCGSRSTSNCPRALKM
jgi:hypothetical protein